MRAVPVPKSVEVKKRGRTQRYTDEYYMMMAKECVDNGMSYREAAIRYKCSHGTINHWVKLYRNGGLKTRVTKERKEFSQAALTINRQDRYIKELKAQVGELYLENQLLKKAQAHFHQFKSDGSSVITSKNLDLFPEVAK